MPSTIFPAPGSSTSTQYLTNFAGFDSAPVQGLTYKNLLTFTQDLSNTAWTKTNVTITPVATQTLQTGGTTGTNTFTVTATTGIAINQPVSGTGLPSGTYVTAINSTTITVSKNFTTTGSGTYNFYNAFGNNTVTSSSATQVLSKYANVSASTQYTFSFYAKVGNATAATFGVYDNTNSANLIAPTSYYSTIYNPQSITAVGASGSNIITLGVPFLGTYSTSFGGSNTIYNSTVDVRPTADFTLEGWFYFTGGSQNTILTIGSETTGRINFFQNGANGALQYNIYGAGSVNLTATTIANNTWTYIAIVRSGSNMITYVNGIGGTAVSLSGTLGNANGFYVMGSPTPAGQGAGFVSNLRLVLGTPVYTANFNPSYVPLTNITNTKLLLCNSASPTKDNSSNNYTITNFGSVGNIDGTISLYPGMSVVSGGGITAGTTIISMFSGTNVIGVNPFTPSTANIALSANNSGTVSSSITFADQRWQRITGTFTTASNTANVSVYPVWTIASGFGTTYIASPQLEKGSTATTYQPVFDLSIAALGLTTAPNRTINFTTNVQKQVEVIKNPTLIDGTYYIATGLRKPVEIIKNPTPRENVVYNTYPFNFRLLKLRTQVFDTVLSSNLQKQSAVIKNPTRNDAIVWDVNNLQKQLHVIKNPTPRDDLAYDVNYPVKFKTIGINPTPRDGIVYNTNNLQKQLHVIKNPTRNDAVVYDANNLQKQLHVIKNPTPRDDLAYDVNYPIKFKTIGINPTPNDAIVYDANNLQKQFEIVKLPVKIDSTYRLSNFDTSYWTYPRNTNLISVGTANPKLINYSTVSTKTTSGSDTLLTFNNPSSGINFMTSGQTYYGTFNGILNYLTLGTTSSYNFLHNGKSDWTIESWVYFNTAPSGTPQVVLSTGSAAVADTGIMMAFGSQVGNNIALLISGDSLNFIGYQATSILVTSGQWYHVAWTFTSSTKAINLYVNGISTPISLLPSTSVSSVGYAYNQGNAAFQLAIGRYQNATPSGYFNGNISNLRIVNKVVYTGPFTPMGPLTTKQVARTNVVALGGTETSLLALQTSTITADSSVNNFTLVNNGSMSAATQATAALGTVPAVNDYALITDTTTNNQALAQISAVSSVPVITPYSVNFVSASSQYLTLGTTSSFNYLHNGTSDWTMEAWVNFTTLPGTNQFSVASTGLGGIGDVGINMCFGFSNNEVSLLIGNGSGTIVVWSSATNVITNTSTWYHVAWTFNKTTQALALYINGVPTATSNNSPGSFANTVGYAYSSSNSTYQMAIGRYQYTVPAGYFNGYISNLRITKQILYTGAFTLATSSFTLTSQGATASNVGLLACQSSTIIDNSYAPFTITNNNTATVSSAVVPSINITSYTLSVPTSSVSNLNISNTWAYQLWEADLFPQSNLLTNTSPQTARENLYYASLARGRYGVRYPYESPAGMPGAGYKFDVQTLQKKLEVVKTSVQVPNSYRLSDFDSSFWTYFNNIAVGTLNPKYNYSAVASSQTISGSNTILTLLTAFSVLPNTNDYILITDNITSYQSLVKISAITTLVSTQGQQLYTTSGTSGTLGNSTGPAAVNNQYTYTFTVPSGVTSISVVVVGGGGGASANSISGGGGGGLAYANNIAVSSGQQYTVVVGGGGVGVTGATSYFSSLTDLFANGGAGGTSSATGGAGGTTGGNLRTSSFFGGQGGTWVNGGSYGTGGGGAGGWAGAGGTGGGSNFGTAPTAPTASIGGGGGGGGGVFNATNVGQQGGAGGGGVGVAPVAVTTGAAGATGTVSLSQTPTPGGGGSGGNAGATPGLGSYNGANGGLYGGGAGSSPSVGVASTGGDGAVRIMWGAGRSFPATIAYDLPLITNITIPTSGIPNLNINNSWTVQLWEADLFKQSNVKTNVTPLTARENLYYATLARGRYGQRFPYQMPTGISDDRRIASTINKFKLPAIKNQTFDTPVTSKLSFIDSQYWTNYNNPNSIIIGQVSPKIATSITSTSTSTSGSNTVINYTNSNNISPTVGDYVLITDTSSSKQILATISAVNNNTISIPTSYVANLDPTKTWTVQFWDPEVIPQSNIRTIMPPTNTRENLYYSTLIHGTKLGSANEPIYVDSKGIVTKFQTAALGKGVVDVAFKPVAPIQFWN